MGPVRGGLILTVLPAPLWAQVCETLRPDWSGPPETMVGEALFLVTTVPSVALMCLTVLAFRLRHQWLALAATVGWTLYASIIAMPTEGSLHIAARSEGCVGSPALFIAVIAVISVGMITYCRPRPAAPAEGE